MHSSHLVLVVPGRRARALLPGCERARSHHALLLRSPIRRLRPLPIQWSEFRRRSVTPSPRRPGARPATQARGRVSSAAPAACEYPAFAAEIHDLSPPACLPTQGRPGPALRARRRVRALTLRDRVRFLVSCRLPAPSAQHRRAAAPAARAASVSAPRPISGVSRRSRRRGPLGASRIIDAARAPADQTAGERGARGW